MWTSILTTNVRNVEVFPSKWQPKIVTNENSQLSNQKKNTPFYKMSQNLYKLNNHFFCVVPYDHPPFFFKSTQTDTCCQSVQKLRVSLPLNVFQDASAKCKLGYVINNGGKTVAQDSHPKRCHVFLLPPLLLHNNRAYETSSNKKLWKMLWPLSYEVLVHICFVPMNSHLVTDSR